jgi:EAL domain-containing protein (putative c-di-GMP-specific phosphodiesterase class I)
VPSATLRPFDELDQVLGDRAVRAVFQPIVELATGEIVAFEALARGPVGSALERPDVLFAQARAAGRLSELDWMCRGAALRGALDAGLDGGVPLFVNVEPEALWSTPTGPMSSLLREASETLSVVVEITERALVRSPATLLHALSFVRGLGFGVAIDDVGAEVASLALMPFVRPDVIKLDLRLVQQQPDGPLAAIVGAVDAQAERTGAEVLAEGIETAAHLDTALAMGATLGQGWLFGRPGAISMHRRATPGRLAPPAAATSIMRSPMAAAAAGRPSRRSTKPLLLEMSRHLERQALQQGSSAVVLGAFQTADRFTPATAARYRQLGERAAFVAAMGVGMPREPAPGVRGGELQPDDPLADEWAVAIVGPHFVAALAARDLGDRGPDRDRRFDYVLTYERSLVLAIADSLMARVTAT